MKCRIHQCDKSAISQTIFIGLPLPIRIDDMCLEHGKKYAEGERLLVEFVR